MNIWVEYWKKEQSENTNYYAQSRPVKWTKPDDKNVTRRFCQNRDDAARFAKSMQEQGYHAIIKQDGVI